MYIYDMYIITFAYTFVNRFREIFSVGAKKYPKKFFLLRIVSEIILQILYG